MNCKPGDLAIVIDSGAYPETLGMIIRVTKVCPIHKDCWETDPPYFVAGYRLPAAFNDCCLRPIRDPGEDATDETLLWLPVPSVEAVAA